MENVVIISCIFDVQKRTKLDYKRTGMKYCHLFNYVNNLNLNTILFIEPHLIEFIKRRSGLILVEKNLEDLKTYKLMEPIKDTLKCPDNAPNVELYFSSVVNSKAELLTEANDYLSELDNFRKITHLIWLDAGIAHVGTIPENKFIDNIKMNIYKDKITTVMMKATSPNEIKNEEKYLSINHGKIAAGLCIVPINLVDWYQENLYHKFKNCVTNYNRFCIEEQLISILTVNYPGKFEYIFSDYWMLPNLVYITNRLDTVIKNLSYCRENSLLDIGYLILIKLLNSLNYARSLCSNHELCQILYDGQIISFYKNKELSKKLSFFLAYLYYNNIDCKSWINYKYSHIRDNLKFSEVDIDKKEEFTDEKILKLDVEGLLWNVH